MSAEAVGDRRDAVDLAPRGPVEGGFEDVGLGGEVPRGRGQRDLGLRGDAAVCDGGDTLAGDDADRRGDDRVADPSGGLGARAGLRHAGEDYRYDRTCKSSTVVLGSPAVMEQTPTTRRSFFGVAGGAALLCTIGGKEVDVSTPGGLRKADAAAAQVRRPRAAAAQAVPQIQPAPGGTTARVLDPGRDHALGDHADAPRRLAQPQPLGQERLHGVRLPPDDARVRRLRRGGIRRSPARR